MIKNFSFMQKEAKRKLSRIGMSLFYLYLFLSISGGVGVIFGTIAMILKPFSLLSILNAPLWQIISLIIISWFTMKLFLQESMKLLEIDKLCTEQKINHNTQIASQETINKVIPFKKKI